MKMELRILSVIAFVLFFGGKTLAQKAEPRFRQDERADARCARQLSLIFFFSAPKIAAFWASILIWRAFSAYILIFVCHCFSMYYNPAIEKNYIWHNKNYILMDKRF